MIEFPHGAFGPALNLEDAEVGAIHRGDNTSVEEGDEARRTAILRHSTAFTSESARKIPTWRECSIRSREKAPCLTRQSSLRLHATRRLISIWRRSPAPRWANGSWIMEWMRSLFTTICRSTQWLIGRFYWC